MAFWVPHKATQHVGPFRGSSINKSGHLSETHRDCLSCEKLTPPKTSVGGKFQDHMRFLCSSPALQYLQWATVSYNIKTSATKCAVPSSANKTNWNHGAILWDPDLRLPWVLEWDVLGLGLLWCTGLGSGGYEGSAAPMGHVPRAITEHSRWLYLYP